MFSPSCAPLRYTPLRIYLSCFLLLSAYLTLPHQLQAAQELDDWRQEVQNMRDNYLNENAPQELEATRFQAEKHLNTLGIKQYTYSEPAIHKAYMDKKRDAGDNPNEIDKVYQEIMELLFQLDPRKHYRKNLNPPNNECPRFKHELRYPEKGQNNNNVKESLKLFFEPQKEYKWEKQKTAYQEDVLPKIKELIRKIETKNDELKGLMPQAVLNQDNPENPNHLNPYTFDEELKSLNTTYKYYEKNIRENAQEVQNPGTNKALQGLGEDASWITLASQEMAAFTEKLNKQHKQFLADLEAQKTKTSRTINWWYYPLFSEEARSRKDRTDQVEKLIKKTKEDYAKNYIKELKERKAKNPVEHTTPSLYDTEEKDPFGLQNINKELSEYGLIAWSPFMLQLVCYTLISMLLLSLLFEALVDRISPYWTWAKETLNLTQSPKAVPNRKSPR